MLNKNLLNKYLILYFIFSFFYTNSVFGQFFKKIGIEHGLSNLSVLTIHQDTLGRMWFGTNEGINVYDGNKITQIKSYNVIFDGKLEQRTLASQINQIVGNNGYIFIRNKDKIIEYDILKETFKEISKKNVRTIITYDNELWYFVNDSLMTYNPKTFTHNFRNRFSIPEVTCMEFTNKCIYIGTKKGLYTITNNKISCIIPDIEIYRLYFSSLEDLWVASRMQGLFRVKRNGEVKKETQAPSRVVSPQIREFVEDEQNRVWFGTFEGLQVYNPYTDEFKVFLPGDKPGMLEHQSVFSLCKDNQGTIWVGTYYGGINYFNLQYDFFTYYSYDSNMNGKSLSFPIVGQIVEDKDRNLWIATDGGGINFFNRKNKTFSYYKSSNENSILHDNVKTLAYDNDRDCIYVGTYTGGLSRYDKAQKSFYNYLSDTKKGENKPDGRIYYCKYYKNHLYISSANGFWQLDLINNVFKRIALNYHFWTFEIDKNDNIWLATEYNLYTLKRENNKILRCTEIENQLPYNTRITKILSASDGTIYFSTLGAGVLAYDMRTKELKQFSKSKNGLLSDFCYNLVETPMNNILITNDRGISIFSPFNKTIRSIELRKENGMISAVAEGCGICVASDDQIYVGGVDGLVSFNDREYSKTPNIESNFYFESLYINNAKVNPDDDSNILKNTLPYTKDISLNHDQNNILLTFASSNYVALNRTLLYQYKLDGFDDDWITTDLHAISYTNLPPGYYKLHVKELGSKLGYSDNKEIMFDIIIRHPWYANIYAYLIYVIIVSLMLYILWRVKSTRKELALSLEHEKHEKERIEEINNLKLRFFTNVSHEFRTPLTLIIGQLEAIFQDKDISGSVHRKLQRVYKNSINMRDLITELLDFRKLEQGYLTLQVQKCELVSYIQEIFDSFKDYAKQRNIIYNFYYSDDTIEAWIDVSQMKKVIINILSNAFKFTPYNGQISVSVSRKNKMIEICIEDNGCGIPPKELDNIFKRFYQIKETSAQSLRGSGIGLALTKGIIDLHKGNIEVDSIIGKGSVFNIQLPIGNSHFNENVIMKDDRVLINTTETAEAPICEILNSEDGIVQTEDLCASENDEGSLKPTMLIVDDESDIVDLLYEIFSPMYKLYKSYNGADGLEMAKNIHPDIIISDIMMPVMSGKEMCYKLKNCVETSHIPIVLLTAQTSMEQTIEGYMFGADDYICKPFNVKLLISRCNNIVNNRRRLLRTACSEQVAGDDMMLNIKANDRILIEKAESIIRANIDRSDFDMNILASEMNIGRSKLYTKIKEITGLTPNEFTLNIKLKEGMRLLRESPELNVAEISYSLGFSSPRYFSKCFKDFYGQPPLYFRKSK